MSIRDELIGKTFPVLDRGWIRLAGLLGDDATICDRARGTIGGNPAKRSSDKELIRFLMRNSHSSPFEFGELDIQFHIPHYIKNQLVRHRAGSLAVEGCRYDDPSVSELSGRYAESDCEFQVTPPDGWRKQSRSNRQGSEGAVTDWPGETPGCWSSPGDYLSEMEKQLQQYARRDYEVRLAFGVAREQARKDLPLSTYTTLFVKMDLRNWLHWVGLRMAGDAQAEHQELARVIAHEIIAPLFPTTWQAFRDYHLNSMMLTELDVFAIRKIAAGMTGEGDVFGHIENRRERQESVDKLTRLGLWKEEVTS